MEFDTITIDTQVVETNSFDFDGGLLAQLKQFKDGPAKVVVSRVVINEIVKHLREKSQGAKDAAEGAHKKLILYGLKSKDDRLFPDDFDVRGIATKRLQQYLEDFGAEIVDAEDVLVPELLKMYFSSAPPFGNSSKKKSEFPDAIALVSLDKWAIKNGAKILAVSGDSDWLSFKTENVTPVSDLAEALAKLQTGVDQARDAIQKVFKEIAEDKRLELVDELNSRVEDAVSSLVVMAEADSSLELESEGVFLSFKGVDLDIDPDDLTLVQVANDKIVVETRLTVTVDAEADFAMSVYDSVDKDMISMGSMSASRNDFEFEVTALITVEGDFDSDEISIADVEIIKSRETINFGYLEPDFRDEPFDFGDEDEDEVVPDLPEENPF